MVSLAGCTCAVHDTVLGSNLSDSGAGCATSCDGECVDVSRDRAHCGACDVACRDGFRCNDGACVVSCQVGLQPCGETCRSLHDDRLNCGSCGLTCDPGFACVEGQCQLTCQAGLTNCQGTCRALDDADHCGACDVVCPAGKLCAQGTCVSSCGSGYSACDGGCRALDDDPRHCGACDHACGPAETCTGGACQPIGCGPGLFSCDGGCTDTASNALHCGACGVHCAQGAVCSGGACQPIGCGPGLFSCDGGCTDTSSNALHCGACGVHCAQGTVCTGGACQPIGCGPGLFSCDGGCTDTSSNALHCGACGVQCPSGMVCTGGACVASCQPGFVRCGNTCVDPLHDPAHCGATAGCGVSGGSSGIACDPEDACVNGACALVCVAGGDAPFAPLDRVRLSLASNPRAVVRDVNGDGRADVLAVDYDADELLLMFGLPDGGLTPPSRRVLTPNGLPLGISVFDVNHDGKLDLTVPEYLGRRLDLLIGDGDGGFTLSSVPLPGMPSGATANDFNGDGTGDFVVGTYVTDAGPSFLRLWLMLGVDGGYDARVLLNEPPSVFPYGITSGDLNDDGKGDLVVPHCCSANTTVYFGAAAGLVGPALSFSPGSNSRAAAIADVDGDSVRDLVVAATANSALWIMRGDGDGGLLAPSVVPVPIQLEFFTAADFDGDHRTDFAFADVSSLWLMRGLGGGAYDTPVRIEPHLGTAISTASGDLTGDGLADLVVGSTLVDLEFFRGGDGGTLTAFASNARHYVPASVEVHDLDFDGRLDLLVGNTGSAAVTVHLATSDGGFGAPVTLDGGGAGYQLLVTDLNADGLPDLVTDDQDSNTVAAFLGAGGAAFTRTATLASIPTMGQLAVGDFTSDGVVDVVAAGRGAYVYAGLGDGTFAAPVIYDAGVYVNALAAKDMNHDGKLDVVLSACAPSSQAAMRVLLGNGAGQLTSVLSTSTPRCAFSLDIGDVNRDGAPDVVAINTASNIDVLLGTPGGALTLSSTISSAAAASIIKLFDFDADGMLDLVLTAHPGGSYRGVVQFLAGKGDGSFWPPVALAAGVEPYTMAVGDIDRDGKADLLVADYAGNQIVVLRGRNTCGP